MGLEWDPEGDRERGRENRARLYMTIAVVVGILGFAASKLVRYQEEKKRERDMEEMARINSDFSAGYTPTYSYNAASAAEVDTSTREVCRRLLSCNGMSNADVEKGLQGCVTAQSRMVTDDFSRSVLATANKQILATCGPLPCEKFAGCYMDELKKLAGTPTTSTPISPETKARVLPLICAVAREHPGKTPDLNAPDASPKATQLRAEIAGLDTAAVADLMKEAIATCTPPK